MHKTLVLIKPDAFKRELVGKIISRFEDAGFLLAGCHLFIRGHVLYDKLASHYAEHEGKSFYWELMDFMRQGPVMAIEIWHRSNGDNVVQLARHHVGATDPAEAHVDTIRGDLRQVGAPVRENLVHSSDSDASARRELRIWGFDP